MTHSFLRVDNGSGALLIVFNDKKKLVFAFDTLGKLYSLDYMQRQWRYEDFAISPYYREYT